MVFNPKYPLSFISKAKTATSDNVFKLVTADLWFNDLNIKVVTNDAKIGDATNQDSTVSAGDIVYFQKVNLNDIYFINATAGSNTTIQVYGGLMSPKDRQELGVE